jgi:hypothetical protein
MKIKSPRNFSVFYLEQVEDRSGYIVTRDYSAFYGKIPDRETLRQMRTAIDRTLAISDQDVADTNAWIESQVNEAQSGRTTIEKQKPKGCVYLAKSDSHSYVKIGFSVDPVMREKTLQAEDPCLEFIFVSRPIYTLEHEESIHASYSEKRKRGEWFDLSELQIKLIIGALSL